MAAFAVGLVLLLAMAGHSDAAYCICNDGVSEKVMQENIDYACGDGADCSAIHQNGACYNPDTVKDHCNYAVNSYYQRKGQGPGSCDFKGTASVTQSVPNVGSGCVYPSSPSNAGNTTPTGPTAGGTPNAAGGTTAGTLTPPGGIGLAPTGSGFGYPDGSDGVALLHQGSTFVLLVSFSIALLVSGIMGPRI